MVMLGSPPGKVWPDWVLMRKGGGLVASLITKPHKKEGRVIWNSLSMWPRLLEGGETREELGYKCALFSLIVQQVPHLMEGYCLHPGRAFLPQLNVYGKTSQVCPEEPLRGNSKPSHIDMKRTRENGNLTSQKFWKILCNFPNFITLNTDLPFHPAIPLLELIHLKQKFGDTNANIIIY